ncbi:Glycerol-3-phosphate acyltransferase [Aliiroseovarius sp. xm-m-379]|uniref:glycerol-3-phosphate 1-O-acyltransferase PlsY n=1 Tax=unclassified Aliiroseovarius TaxID=2623558 RepID=UPI001569D9DA|nr:MULTISPECIES: glycerol-3-phosphate 1-O-acyltransferase PlsY [unclassified Aliiroseovarius]NRP13874.1 Glycerol-3-phosphate acyltransferase [Aliiroseovarius sp. xm-d-517]NRP25481.1 Glycerol-3-phosphate acyltransferase [Aliiroseovarius sp. xm-m-379]NRP29474.1 Glycerol-3-phosphate acyltransferase [Aliiroseovarius sp. xm-m-314]NRP34280.1 Glycerol-3-phosphate acyltransferase [Aliiroseovarius sp. xm-a-104]NRP41761.1 Glycerol-3-phosphate acyltransferase [Aliiroseovarius sp. xm-m-339-2]
MPELTSVLPVLALVAVLGYLLGSIPFGIVMARLFGLGDLRQIGSGNIGATNVLRTGNKLAAFLTLIGDAGKGGAAALAARALVGEDAAQIAGFFAFLGHCFPVFLGFRGGKGVATWLGTMLALSFPLGLAACASWLVTAVVFRISSLSALVAAALSPVVALLLGQDSLVGLAVALAALIFYRHSANISRILKGEEPKIGKKE